MSGLATADAEDGGAGADEDDGPIPKYPRSTLRLVLSDGSFNFNAFEYRRLPKLELGSTPLGCKVTPGSPSDLIDILI
jgi:RecQ-mediated genome instability protein 1